MEDIKFFDNKNYKTRLLKKKIKNLLLFFFPNILVKKLMEKSYTDIGFEISNACNANCTFCAYRFQERKKHVMDFEMYKKAIDNYSNDGGGTVSFTPVVGDPLVDRKLIDKIKYARSKDNIKDVFLYTNALFFDRYNLDELVSSGITRIAISTYFGSRELYKKYYGVDGYDRVIKNITDLLKKNKQVGKPINFTFHLRVEQPVERWQKNKEFIEISKLNDNKNISFKTKYENWSGMIKDDDLPEGCELGETLEFKNKIKDPCWELYRKFYIMSDARVGVCASRDLEGEICIGNVKEKSLNNIWRDKPIRKFRKDWVKGRLPKVCMKCDRYRPISNYIEENKFEILKTQVFSRKN